MILLTKWWKKHKAQQKVLRKPNDLDGKQPCLNSSTPLSPEIEAEVDAKVEARIGKGGYMGYCHQFWSCKKQILKEEYGIDWLSPAERNPGCRFD